MAELVDAHDSKSCGVIHGSSILPPGTEITEMKKIPLLVILGPTASGKSDLAVKIAKMIARERVGGIKGAEIISADSRQIYRGMDIGTGKITKKEMQGIPHHLLDVADPNNRFDAEQYRILARATIDDVVSRGKLPIICGGTGFYIDTILKENLFPNIPPDENLRKKLSKKSVTQLLLILKKLDPKRAQIISKSNSEKNNARRIVRAVEIASFAGQMLEMTRKGKMEGRRFKVSTGRSGASAQGIERPSLLHQYAPIFIGIKLSKEDLKKRIRARLLQRLKNGMIAEARRLHEPRTSKNPAGGLSWKRMEELGLEYRYLAKYLQGKMSKEEFVEKLNTEIWHYAKRQMTWFRRNSKIQWFGLKQESKVRKIVDRLLKK